MKNIFIITLLLFLAYRWDSYADDLVQVELILDASRSMREMLDGRSKISIAVVALNHLAEELGRKKNIIMGLRIFGHRNKSCTNSILEIPVGKAGPDSIRKMTAGIIPVGNTPIAYSLKMAADDFKKEIRGEKIIFLITDGNENCRNNPCETALKLKKAGITSKIHIVGLGIDNRQIGELKCIAGPSGGMVIRANNLKETVKGLDEIFGPLSDPPGKLERPGTNNLVVTGMDKQEKRIFIRVDVLKNKKSIASSDGETVGFSLSDGTYELVVRSSISGQTITIDNVEVRNDVMTRKNIKFGEGDLLVIAWDANGNQVESSIEILKSESGEMIVKKERVELKVDTLNLIPGKYDIRVQDLETGFVKELKSYPVASGQNRAQFTFKRGTIVIQAKSIKGVAKFISVETYVKGGRILIKQSTGEKIHRHILLPGFYDIKINDWYGKGEQWLRDIEVLDGKTIHKEAVFTDSE